MPYLRLVGFFDGELDTVFAKVYLDEDWLAEVRRHHVVLPDNRFFVIYDAWDESRPDRRPIHGLAVRALPATLLPDGEGTDFEYALSDASTDWRSDTPTVTWDQPELHAAAIAYGEQIREPRRDQR